MKHQRLSQSYSNAHVHHEKDRRKEIETIEKLREHRIVTGRDGNKYVRWNRNGKGDEATTCPSVSIYLIEWRNPLADI